MLHKNMKFRQTKIEINQCESLHKYKLITHYGSLVAW